MTPILFPTASLALILAAQPAPAFTEPGSMNPNDPGPPAQYNCENGMTIGVSHLGVHGFKELHSAVEVEFPTGREAGERTTQLLPSTQTGSGVRFASDITELHLKDDTGRFATRASAKSEAIPSVACTRESAEDPDAPITQEARAGRYFIDGQHTTAYAPVEVACLAPDAAGYLGVNRAAGKNRAVTYNGRGTKQAEVGPVDAGAGQRRYTLTSLKNSRDQITLHFIAPGMREAELPSATAGLNSLSQGSDRVECVDNDRVVYAGIGGGLGLEITAEEDGLGIRTFGENKEPIWKDMRQGYVTIGERMTVFHFFDGPSLIRVETSHGGMPGVDENGMQISRNWQLDTPFAQRTLVPEAYFVAHQEVLAAHAPTLSASTSQLLDSLSICNHLAGETSEDPERNAQLSMKLEEAKCDAVPGLYTDALASAPSGSPLQEYLESNSPNWM